MKVPSLRAQAAATVAILAAGFTLVFFYAPLDTEGFIQKIFYLHVPLAICSLAGFVVAGIHAIRHLRSGDPVHDARSYVSIHLSVIFGIAVLVTGSIWARAQWGKWWVWDEPTLVSFLIVFLLYVTYYPLRYAIEDRERQARYASVFAITAGAFVPLRLGELDERPHVPAHLMPALPLDEAGKYVAAAYVVFVALILVYVAIMAAKLERIQRELGELADLAEQKLSGGGGSDV